MQVHYALYSVRSVLPHEIANVLFMVNRKYWSEQIATSRDYFAANPAHPNVQSGLTAITVCVERRYLFTTVYLNIHKLCSKEVKQVYESLPLYLRYVEGLSSKYPDVCHIVQGDYNPTQVNRSVLGQYSRDMGGLGFIRQPPQSAPGRVALDWTFTKGLSLCVGGESNEIFETTARREHLRLKHAHI